MSEEPPFPKEEIPPDLHEELAAASAESRRNARRVMDALKQIGEMLNAMSGTLSSLHATQRERSLEETPASTESPIALIDLHDRIDRISAAFERNPEVREPWWPPARRALRVMRQDRILLADSFTILSGHVAKMLSDAGLEKIPSEGLPFDPSCMDAIEVVSDPTRPDHTVVSEILSGWRLRGGGAVVRPCQVRVSRNC